MEGGAVMKPKVIVWIVLALFIAAGLLILRRRK